MALAGPMIAPVLSEFVTTQLPGPMGDQLYVTRALLAAARVLLVCGVTGDCKLLPTGEEMTGIGPCRITPVGLFALYQFTLVVAVDVPPWMTNARARRGPVKLVSKLIYEFNCEPAPPV